MQISNNLLLRNFCSNLRFFFMLLNDYFFLNDNIEELNNSKSFDHLEVG